MKNCRNYAQNSLKAVKTLRETDIAVSKHLGCNKQKYSPLGSKNGGLSPRRRPPPLAYGLSKYLKLNLAAYSLIENNLLLVTLFFKLIRYCIEIFASRQAQTL